MKVLLTGGTKGIGLAILKMLVSNRYETTVIGRTPLLGENYTQTKFIECDLADVDMVRKLCKLIQNQSFDILINNAGGGNPVKIEDLCIEQINKEINLNLISPILLIKAVLSNMKKNKFGRIVNISSISSKRGTPFLYVYSAAKAGINSITQSLSRDLANTGITVNSICPGGVDTDMSIKGRMEISKLFNYEPEQYQKNMIKQMGIGGLISTEEIASFVEYLIKPESGFISGQSINICGTLEVV